MYGKGHNFIRLWTPGNGGDFEANGSGYYPIGKAVNPTLYERITQAQCDTLIANGQSCDGNDGLRKFDLMRLNQGYFDRLRDRIIAARDKNIYVSIMLFDGWGVGVYQNSSDSPFLWWLGHPYNIGNNVNMTHGWPDATHPRDDGVACNTGVNDVTDFQTAYIAKVIDTVKDLDNVLFEVANEALGSNGANSPVPGGGTLDSTQWQYYVIELIQKLEANNEADSPIATYRHPVGMTGQYWGTNNELDDSPADWIS